LLEVVDAHEQLLALEEEAVDLDVLRGEHYGDERRGGEPTKHTDDTKVARWRSEWLTEGREDSEEIGAMEGAEAKRGGR